ncbi:MAG: hypothetical protein M3Y70_03590 [Pseudomonadota bacterium]|nr:hypothetical protein [Pseudomonadota bacterium]
MGLLRDQIDLKLTRIAAEARQSLRANRDDSAISQMVISRTRDLLRTAPLEHHLHICDTAQHLLLTLGLDDDDDDGASPSSSVLDDPDLIRVVQLCDGPPPADVGLQLLDDPFDVDAFLPSDAGSQRESEGAAVACAPMPVGNERRGDAEAVSDVALRRGLSDRQLATLDTMSNFGWTLRFVRRPMFLPPIPVAFDRNRQRYVVVEPDGSVDEDPDLQVRD